MKLSLGTCLVISTTQAQELRRAYGTWPTPEFNGLSEEVQIQFWQQCKTKHSASDIRMLAKETLEKHETHEEFYSDS